MTEISEKEIEAAIKAFQIAHTAKVDIPLEQSMRDALEAAARVRAENDAFQDAAVTGLGVMYMTDAGAIRHIAPTVYRVGDVEPHPAPQPSGWQPIETAPKDGTDILGWHEIAGTSQTCFSEGEWVCPDWDEDQYIHCTWSPTHWMPLPTPPTAGGGDE